MELRINSNFGFYQLMCFWNISLVRCMIKHLWETQPWLHITNLYFSENTRILKKPYWIRICKGGLGICIFKCLRNRISSLRGTVALHGSSTDKARDGITRQLLNIKSQVSSMGSSVLLATKFPLYEACCTQGKLEYPLNEEGRNVRVISKTKQTVSLENSQRVGAGNLSKVPQ